MAWKCPKCGREFNRQNHDHYCVKPQNIDEYIAVQDEKYKPRLMEIREILRDQGYKRVSLAVQKANYAVKMYQKTGFRIMNENDEEFIMVCEL